MKDYEREIKSFGFTLLEIIIAVSIFAVISICLYSIMRGGILLWKRQSGIMDINSSIRFFLDDIAKELRNSIMYHQPEKSFRIKSEEEPEPAFKGTQKSITFYCVKENKKDKNMSKDILKIRYELSEDSEGDKYIKKIFVSQRKGFNEDSADESILLSGIKDLAFQYAVWNEKEALYEWVEHWESEGPPRGVRVRLVLKEKAESMSGSIITKSIFIPSGLPQEELGSKK